MNSKNLRQKAAQALSVVNLTRAALADLELRIDERTATAVPLALASMDTAVAIYKLLAEAPEQLWVAALTLQRTQMEYVLRAAFFSKAASRKELMAFRQKGKMPKRGKDTIYIADVATEASEHLGWDKDKVLATVKAHQKDLSELVHGGRAVLAIYTRHDAWGDLTVEWDELVHHVDNILVFSVLAITVAMSLSPLAPEPLDKAVRPAYEAAMTYFQGRTRSPWKG